MQFCSENPVEDFEYLELDIPKMLETSATIARQYIDAVSVFDALEEALEEAAQLQDVLQADAVQVLLDRYLPHLSG